MNEQQTNNEGRTPGTDVSNFSDYSVRTTDGKEIKLHLYGR
jgi:hypothetical protein